MKSNLNQIFDLFVGTDDHRAALLYPFEIKGKIYATDAHSMVFIDKKYCDFDIENPFNPPNCEAVIPMENMSKFLKIEQSFFDQYKTEDEYIVTEKREACAECNGSGQVEWEYENHTKKDDCPECAGSGDGELEKVKSGNKTFSENLLFKIDDTFFAAKMFYRLLQVKKLLESEIIVLSKSGKHKAYLFSIGICKILLMPVYHDEDREFEIVEIIY